MSKFIEEFYYGNIDPQARSTKHNQTVQKQMEVLMLNEEFLTEALTGENKKKFLDFINAWSNNTAKVCGWSLSVTVYPVGVMNQSTAPFTV